MGNRELATGNPKKAARSTGPVTKEGKKNSSKNALKHGLLSKETLMPGESAEELDALRKAMMAQLEPQGAIEEALAERVVSNLWRLRRLLRIESVVLTLDVLWEMKRDAGTRGKGTGADHDWLKPFLPALRAERAEGKMTVADFTVLNVANELLGQAEQEDGEGEPISEIETRMQEIQDGLSIDDKYLGKAYNADARGPNVITKLMRYETTLERGMYRALHELERLQRARGGEHVSPPALLDVSIDTSKPSRSD